MVRIVCAFLCVLLIGVPARAELYAVDPVQGSDDNPGGRNAPWKSLARALASGVLAPGDRLELATGRYGALNLSHRRNSGEITIAAAEGARPQFPALWIADSAHWRIEGLIVSPYPDPVAGRALVEIGHASTQITLEGLKIFVAPDITGWTVEDWLARTAHGVLASGSEITLRGNHIFNIDDAMTMNADRALVEGNLIENFAGDGIRGLGDYSIYRDNEIRNCYEIDDHHDDGFQSWSLDDRGQPGKGTVIGSVIERNLIISYTDPGRPLICDLQGIGMFGGFFEDWVIRNNVVVVDHWHGITVMGARNVRIVNNTVIDPNDGRIGPPWISITHHKDGRPSENSLIANNITQPAPNHAQNQFGLPKEGVTAVGNLVVHRPFQFFRDLAGRDLRPRVGSPAIDRALPEHAPDDDVEGRARPQGAGPDIGAYEVQ